MAANEKLTKKQRERIRKKREREEKIKRLRLIIILSAAGILIAVYFSVAAFYHDHFIARTTVNGIPIGGLTAEEVRTKLQQNNIDYVLTLQDPDGTNETIRGVDISLKYEKIGDVDSELKEQNRWFWPFRIIFNQKLTISNDVVYDEGSLQTKINALKGIDPLLMLSPVNAYLMVNDKGNYDVVPEVDGTTVDTDAVRAKIVSAIEDGTDTLNLADDQIFPTVRKDDAGLLKRQTEWNDLMTAQGLKYSFFNGIETIDAGILVSLLTDDGTSVTVSSDAVSNLVASWATLHDTYNNVFSFTIHDGSTIEVPAGGDYGWQTDQASTAADIKEKIEAHNTSTHNVVYAISGITDSHSGVGPSWIEVSITNQTLWCYKDNQLVLTTPVVTGLPENGRDTFKGCYSIKYKEEHATLGTLDTQGYASAVDFWMPFNEGEGLHDAPWRTDFGGDIYQSDGSHGCVNIPKEVMGTLFAAAFEGEPVVVY